MDSKQFREFGYQAIDYMANYFDKIRDRKVLPDVEPGYLDSQLPDEVPQSGEDWRDILSDLDKIIMPGMTHWQSPQMHAFFPTASSFPSMIGEMISSGLGVIGLHWTASPVCTELEVKMMNWLGKLLNLPPQFLNCHSGPGGGVIQCSASDTTFLCLIAAQSKSVRRLKKLHPEMSEGEIRAKLVAYTSEQANSSVEKSGIIASMKMRILKSDENGILRKETLSEAMKNDVNQGLFPCYVIATMGSTGICADDDLEALGPVCKQNDAWLHVDAAYAGAALILPEYQYMLKGVEYADSFCFNPHKWLLVNFDCSALWVQNAADLIDSLAVERIYLKDHENVNTQLPEYRNWQLPLGRKFRALKLWFVLRTYGKEGLQAHLRNHIGLAKYFASLVENDSRFELICPPKMGLVCFRLIGDNALSEKLHQRLMDRKNVYMITATANTKFFLRFVVCSPLTTADDVNVTWNEITSQAEEILSAQKIVLNGHSK